LENRLSRNRPGGHASCCPGSGRAGSSRSDWGLINRTRSGLRHDHARRRCGNRSGRWLYRHRWSLSCRSGGCGLRRRRRSRMHRRSRRWNYTRRLDTWRWRRGECRADRQRRNYYSGWRRCGSLDRRRCHRRRRWCRRFCFFGRTCYRWTNCRDGGSLLLADGRQHIAWPGDVRQIDLRLDLIGSGPAGTRFRRRLRFYCRTSQAGAYFFGFILFQRTGVSLFLGNSDFRKHVENGFALDFQFSCQIIDSNLAHPPFLLLHRLP